jgi:hypothetical protein
MADAQSNRGEIEDLLDRLAGGFNFETPGIDGRGLGEELLDVVAEGVIDRTLAEQAQPDGAPLAPNAPDYAKRPAKAGKPIGVLSGEMLSQLEVNGERWIDPERAEMTYGQPGSGARRKAEWFTRGSAENPPGDIEHSGAEGQPARPFYALDDEIRARLGDRSSLALDEFLGSL